MKLTKPPPSPVSLHPSRPTTAKAAAPGKEKILLSGVEETLLASIWCRAKDSQSEEPLLGDPYAQQILDRCDVDYTRSTFAALHDERWARL